MAPAGMPLPQTLEEHNDNVAKWREIEAEQGRRKAKGGRAGQLKG
jgi:hypothetical protein